MGRFISRDPIGYDAGDINLYRFVGNNPYGGLDPMGLFRQHEGNTIVPQEIAYAIAVLLQALPSNLSKRLAATYFYGDGSDYNLTIADLQFLEVEKKAKVYLSRECADCGVKQIRNKSYAATTNSEQRGTLGNYSIKLTGTINCECNGWRFNGGLSIDDLWDFNKDGPNRSSWGELKVKLMNWTWGYPFKIWGYMPISISGENGCRE
jgi:hypothetical protein